MMLHTYNPPPMSLPSINFLHLTVTEIQPIQDFIGQGHYGKAKGQIKVTIWLCTPTPPNQCPYQVLTSYTLPFLRYSPNKIFKLKVTTAKSKVKSRSDHDVTHLHLQTNVPTKYQLSTPYGFWDTALTNFFPPPARPPILTPWVKTIPRQPLRAVGENPKPTLNILYDMYLS